MIKEFEFKRPRDPKAVAPTKVGLSQERENLSGNIDGVSASALEERLAKASRRYATYRFKLPLGVPGQPGWKELDFLFFTSGSAVAVEVDDVTFIHRGENPEQDPDDLLRIEQLRYLGVNVDKINHVDNTKLMTQEAANATARRLLT